MFTKYTFYILPGAITKLRCDLLTKSIKKLNGSFVESLPFSDTVEVDDRLPINIVIVGDQIDAQIIDRLIAGNVSESCQILRVTWLTECLKLKKVIPFDPYLVDVAHRSNDIATIEGEVDNSEIDSRDAKQDSTDAESSTPPIKKARFVCETSSTASTSDVINTCPNAFIIEQLEILRNGYKSTNDKWRVFSYEKAINMLRKRPEKIKSLEEAKSLRGIGNRLAEKIWEIVDSGSLRKADEFQNNEKLIVLNRFSNIWGVGPATSEQWYVQGFRTLDDVEKNAKLSHQQKVGLKHYDDFLDRMPWSEADEIVDVVTAAIRKMNPGLVAQGCGSYRRKKSTCGDVDILITHPDGVSHENILAQLIKALEQSGFLTDHLVECQNDDTHKKYMGVCKLPNVGSKYRRIDMISIPFVEYATSLIYFTGSEHFTRSIYAKAKSMGMRLNHHALRGGVIREKGVVIHEGYRIDTSCEQDVFRELGVPFRPPEQRDHN